LRTVRHAPRVLRTGLIRRIRVCLRSRVGWCRLRDSGRPRTARARLIRRTRAIRRIPVGRRKRVGSRRALTVHHRGVVRRRRIRFRIPVRRTMPVSQDIGVRRICRGLAVSRRTPEGPWGRSARWI
ncbi:hypothetical protein, partial [Nocardia amikacinitolerans]|uniref:hypothetical protein n=1 Tax=Nocardia amikacinitolerans TaxID=756689 RepID=UPI0020A5B96F